MWVLDIRGNGLDLTTGRVLALVPKEANSPVSGVCLFPDSNTGTLILEKHSHPIFTGTDAECRAYIADLMERLNAPAIITQGMTEQILREIKRLDNDIQFAHNRIYELEQKTRGLEPDLR